MTIQNSKKEFLKKIFNFFSGFLNRASRLGGHLKFSIRRIGGVSASIKKIVRIFSQEGFAGILKRYRGIVRIREKDIAEDKKNYQLWIKRYDTLTSKSRAKIRNLIKNFYSKPLISIIMPTYNTKSEWLVEAIESVRSQIYPNWELCIADDASTNSDIRPLLESYAKEDSRIKVTFRKKNGHISESSNTALKLATGEWIALFDHDDLLSEHALFWVVKAINENPKVQLIYSDEDKIDEKGVRQHSYFKTDWNLDLFYSHNLITHLGVYHASLVKKIGGFRPGFEGSQDYDLALRCVEHIKPDQIHHIPRVLYHWRMHALSTSQTADSKPYATSATVRALNDHFKRFNKNAKAVSVDFGFRACYKLPAKPPLVSLIIPTRNGLSLLKTCVDSIFEKTTYPNYELIIVDNGSDDPAALQFLDSLKKNKKVQIIRDDSPFNYSALNNKAVKFAKGKIVGLLNNDLEVISPDWLTEMVSHAVRPGIGAVGAKLYYTHGEIQHAGVIIGIGGIAGHAHKHIARNDNGYFSRAVLIQNFSAVTAACLVIRKSVYEEINGLNEKDLTVAFNDVDFCLRVREKGYRNLFTPYAELYHHESATRGYENTPEKIRRFQKELKFMKQNWEGQLLNDPAYNPNLTLVHENFGLAWPPRIKKI